MGIKFTDQHEWVEAEGTSACIGISDYAQKSLGDIVFIELPKQGDKLEIGKEFGTVESVKAVSELYSPASGVVTDVNRALEDAPELLNEDPYENWIIKIELDDKAELESLMDKDQYEKFCESL
ncbi:MAG: glycine cleavage system protein GcvH [Oscillospiraceae bacterium]|nr:glycine cleavage system protein GcvH [Oscillospiraceae bacterium]